MPQFVPFPELHLADDQAVVQWAATALFASDLTTPEIEQSIDVQARALVMVTVRETTETSRARQLANEWSEWPEETAARMTACLHAAEHAPQWPLLDRWKVAVDA